LQKKYPTNGSSIGISDVIVPQPTDSFLIERISKIQNKTDRKKLSIATIGAVDVRYKAQDDVIKAMSILKSDGYDVEYTLIGGGSPERLKQVALDYGLELEKLHFLGTIPHEEIYELLDNFDLYIQPSRTEGLPRSVVEAMSRGLLCICSNVGGMPELVDAKCIYKPGDFRELAEVVEKLIESDEEVVQIIKDNFQKASQFQEEILVNRRSRFLNEIIRTYEL
jgi:glycosyltransferase involved in cell wall biosynthesis